MQRAATCGTEVARHAFRKISKIFERRLLLEVDFPAELSFVWLHMIGNAVTSSSTRGRLPVTSAMLQTGLSLVRDIMLLY